MDFFAAIFVILHILFYAVLVLCYFIFLPGFTKNFINFYGRYKVLNSSDKMKNYRESNRIISFQDEKDFLKDKIKEYDSFYEEVMIQGLDKRDGALGGNDSGVLTSDQTMVLDKMRKLSVFRECKASVGETKKDISIGFVVGCVVITTTVLLAFLNFKAGNHF